MSHAMKMVLAVIISSLISGTGVYLWQTQNSTPQPSIQDKISMEGKIFYTSDGSPWLESAEGRKYEILIQETTVIKNIPENLLDERIKRLMKEAGKTHPWFGLMGNISTYVKENTAVKIEGYTNRIITDEISVLE